MTPTQDLHGHSGLFEVADMQRFKALGFNPTIVTPSKYDSFFVVVNSSPHITKLQLNEAALFSITKSIVKLACRRIKSICSPEFQKKRSAVALGI
jgi:hypothetical protein